MTLTGKRKYPVENLFQLHFVRHCDCLQPVYVASPRHITELLLFLHVRTLTSWKCKSSETNIYERLWGRTVPLVLRLSSIKYDLQGSEMLRYYNWPFALY